MDTSVILVLCLSVLFMSGVIFGVYALMNRAVGVPKRKALKAQKVRSAALTNAMADLTLALTKDALVAVPGIGPERYRDLYELLPLYPLVSILSAQGHVGPCQQEWLRSYLSDSRYNLYQLEQLAVRREGCWEEWRHLAALEDTPKHCGEIWHTLIELLCQVRRPDLLQPITDALGTVMYRFHYLDPPKDSDLPEACFRRMIDDLNTFSETEAS